MTVVPLLAAYAAVPMMMWFKPVDLLVGENCVAVDQQIGDAPLPTIGQWMVANFTLTDGLGRVLADSEQRGLPYAFRYGSPEVDLLLQSAVEDMRPGGERTAFFTDDLLTQGIGSIVPPRTNLILRVRLLPNTPG